MGARPSTSTSSSGTRTAFARAQRRRRARLGPAAARRRREPFTERAAAPLGRRSTRRTTRTSRSTRCRASGSSAFEGRATSSERDRRPRRVLVTTVTPDGRVDGPRLVSTPGDDVNRPRSRRTPNDGGFAVAWSRHERLSGAHVVLRRRRRAAGSTPTATASATRSTCRRPTTPRTERVPAIAYDANADEYLVVWWQHLFDAGRGIDAGRPGLGRGASARARAAQRRRRSSRSSATPFHRGSGRPSTGARAAGRRVRPHDVHVRPAYEITGVARTSPRAGSTRPTAPTTTPPPPPGSRDSSRPAAGAETSPRRPRRSSLPRRCTSRRDVPIRLVERSGRASTGRRRSASTASSSSALTGARARRLGRTSRAAGRARSA